MWLLWMWLDQTRRVVNLGVCGMCVKFCVIRFESCWWFEAKHHTVSWFALIFALKTVNNRVAKSRSSEKKLMMKIQRKMLLKMFCKVTRKCSRSQTFLLPQRLSDECVDIFFSFSIASHWYRWHIRKYWEGHFQNNFNVSGTY